MKESDSSAPKVPPKSPQGLLTEPTAFSQTELGWWNYFMSFTDKNPRRILRLLNMYAVVRQLIPSTNPDDEFRAKLMKILLLMEQWPYRMSWLFQIVDDHMQMQCLEDLSWELLPAESKSKHNKGIPADLKTSSWDWQEQESLSIMRECLNHLLYGENTFWQDNAGSTLADRRTSIGIDSDPEVFEMLLACPPLITIQDVVFKNETCLRSLVINRNISLADHVAYEASQRVKQTLPSGKLQYRRRASLFHDLKLSREGSNTGCSQSCSVQVQTEPQELA